MDELGDLLVLMVNAHRSFRTLRGEVRNWHHNARNHEAVMRAHQARVARGGQMAIAVRPEGAEPEPVEWEETLRVWLAPPDRLREELVMSHDGEPGVAVMVHVGDTWWSYTPLGGAQTNAGSPDSVLSAHLQRGLLDPAQLLASRVFEIVGPTECAGRPAVRVMVTPSPREVFPWERGVHVPEWPQELLVDAERGIVLRCVNLLDGEPFSTVEFLSVAFDEEFPDDTFVFTPPDGEEVLDVRRAPSGRLGPIPLRKAVERAPFGIFVVSPVPDDCQMHVYFSERDERDRWPAAVHIHYTNASGTLNVNLNEHAAGEMDIPSSAPDGNQWVVRHTARGPLKLWEPAEAERGMPRIAMIEIAGTRIQISSDDLDADAIAKLADSLVAAPATP